MSVQTDIRAAAPATFPRRVLLAVSGLSPQIITETLYALAVAAAPAERFVPTEVWVLTTAEGAQRVRLALLSEQPGGFMRLCRDYALPPIEFSATQIRLVHDAAGQPLADIRTEADNALMADAITELVRELSADPACALHVSIAGGRKTMGYYAGYALSLFGRAQDRLSHVLVSAPFESSWEFFYPTPYPQVISVQGGRELADAATAEVSLAQIPFVRLRHVLPADMLQGGAGFAAAVQAAGQRLVPPRLVIDVAAQAIEADGQRIELAPWHFALMALLAQRARAGQPALRAPSRDVHDDAWSAEVLHDLQQALGLFHIPATVERKLRHDASGSTLASHWSRLRKQLAESLGPGRAALYFDDGGTQRHKRYRVPLEAGAIEIRR